MPHRIRILRIITRLNVGGPALHATLLTKRLDPTRYESWLVAGREEPWEGNYLELYGHFLPGLITIPDLGREIRGWADLRAFGHLVRLMREFRPHIVHTHTAKAGFLGRLAARTSGVPVVVHTYHGHVLRGYFSPAQTRLLVLLERFLARHTDRLIAVSERVRQELLELGIGREERFSVVPLGLELERLLSCGTLQGGLRAELGVDSKAPLVGMVARLVPIKRHEWFFEAAARVKKRHPQCHFVLVGDGERRGELEGLANHLGLDGQVHFLGWRKDLERIYADLDLVVLSSANEGLPVSLIEAMAAAKPIVATRVGGVPDLVEEGQTGLLVPPKDPASLARAIEKLLDHPELCQTMGQKGREKVYPAFSSKRLLKDMDKLYTELLAGPKGQR